MTERKTREITGVIVDETTEITVVDLCEVCAIDPEVVEQLVAEGVLDPTGGIREELRFSYSSVRRTRTVVNLQRDLGLNMAGAALALELLDQIEELRARLRNRNTDS